MHLLHLEDSTNDAVMVQDLLVSEWPKCRITRVVQRDQFAAAIEQGGFSAILSDYALPDFDGIQALELARTWCPEVPFIFISGTIGEEIAVQALQRGAADYVIKDRPARLTSAIRLAVTRAEEAAKRRRTEEALRQNQERYRQITENVADMVAVLSIDGRRVYNNPAYRHVLGEPDALRGTDSFREIHPDDRARIRAIFEESVRTGKGQRTDYRFLLKDGSVRYVESQGSVLRDADGNVSNVLVVSRDVTERRMAEMQIREQAALLDKARDAIIATNLEHQIAYWNPSAERLYGWTAAEVFGKDLRDLGLGFDEKRFADAKIVLLTKGEWRGHFQLQCKGGERVYVSTTWSLVYDAAGSPRTILMIDTDLTEEKKLQTQLIRAQRMESIGTLAGGIAHDLNNVLAPILMGAELLKLDALSPGAAKLVNTMETSAQHGAALIRQLMGFARGADTDRSVVWPAKLLDEVTDFLRQTLPGIITLKSQVAPDLPAILADATQLKQVMLNLCLNARDAMPEGGTITISAGSCDVSPALADVTTGAAAGPHVHIEVADTGTGIPPAVLEKIFDPFFTTKGVGKGTGLGLSTVRGILKAHQGFLQVESTVGVGTTFHIYLPVGEAPAPVTTNVASPRGQGETVLILDDDEQNSAILQAFLERHGYRAVVLARARTLRECVPHAETTGAVVIASPAPTAAWLDEIARLNVPVIALNRTAAGAIARGPAWVHLPEPFEPDALLAALANAVRPASAAGGSSPTPGAPP